MTLPRFWQILLLFCIFSGPALADTARPQPELSSGLEEQVASASGEKFMIVTANDHATKAGYEILKRGGSAVDAAIAAQLVLGLVEPQSSGLGGGAFVVYYDANSGKVETFDGRETSPGLNGPFLFYKDGEPLDFKTAQLGGRSVGVPGTPKLLYDLHEKYGSVTWMELFEDAIRLSGEGFEISPRLAFMMAAHQEDLAQFSGSAAYFLKDNGSARKAGERLANPAYEETLKDYAFHGAQIFYHGALAGDIVEAVQNAPLSPAAMTAQDLQSYAVQERDAVCGPYRGFIVCSMGEPSSGGLTILQTLGMIERFDLPGWGADDARSWSVISQASALAFSDRNQYMADPDFVNTPGVLLLDPEYVETRSALIDPQKPPEMIEPGKPPLWDGPLYARSPGIDKPGTTHISVIDADGNIVSMTSTIESAFGSHIMVGGFLLNNELTDFSFEPFSSLCHPVGVPKALAQTGSIKERSGASHITGSPLSKHSEECRGDDRVLVANMVEGGKRPRSSMAPTIVFDAGTGKPVLVLGSAGGSRIIGYVLQRIIATLDWGMEIDEALSMPHILSRSGTIEAEPMARQGADLKALGFEVERKMLNSGLTAVQVQGDTYRGAADPRREGTAMGE